MATSTKKKPAQTKAVAPRARTTREKTAKKPTKREEVAKLPVVNHHIDAAIGGSNARELIKKVNEAAASLIEVQHQARERQQSKPQRSALQEEMPQEKTLQEKMLQDKGQEKPQ